VFSGVFIGEVDGVEDKGSGDKTTVYEQTFLKAILNISLQSVCLMD
jgi:hypothetical protein